MSPQYDALVDAKNKAGKNRKTKCSRSSHVRRREFSNCSIENRVPLETLLFPRILRVVLCRESWYDALPSSLSLSTYISFDFRLILGSRRNFASRASAHRVASYVRDNVTHYTFSKYIDRQFTFAVSPRARMRFRCRRRHGDSSKDRSLLVQYLQSSLPI